MSTWTRYGCEGGACIETTDDGSGNVVVRDSSRSGFLLLVPATTWEAFLAAVRAPVEAERDDAERSVQAHREMTNQANARLRAVLLAALGLGDDGRTSLTEYVALLVAQLAAAAPVLDAARALRSLPIFSPDDDEGQAKIAAAEAALEDALAALDGVSPEGTASPPGATQAAPQAPGVRSQGEAK